MRSDRLPIGYWIRKADETLTKSIDALLAPFALTRTHWQILNTVSERPALTRTDLVTALTPLADVARIETLLDELQAKAILHESNGGLSLTKQGQQLHEACLEKQQAFRRKVMTGIESEAYEVTVQTLQKLIENSNDSK